MAAILPRSSLSLYLSLTHWLYQPAEHDASEKNRCGGNEGSIHTPVACYLIRAVATCHAWLTAAPLRRVFALL